MTMESREPKPEADGTAGPPVSSRVSPAFRVVTMLCGLAAGVAAWAIGESFYGYFGAPMRKVTTMGYVSFRATPGDLVAANIKNALIPYGVLTALTAVTLGMLGAGHRRNLRAGVVGGLWGLALGIPLTGALTIASLLGYWSYFGENPLTEELLVPLLSHMVSWAGVGAAGGLSLGLALGGGRSVVLRSILWGVIGALLGTLVYELVGAALFPLHRTTFPVSASSVSRGLARTSVAVGVTVFAMLGALATSTPQAVKSSTG